jgi:hypothetical protein
VRELVARDSDSGAGRHRAQAPVDAIEHDELVKRSELDRGFQFRGERDEMPAQPVLHPGALGDQVAAVI